MAIFEGLGDMVELVEHADRLLISLDNQIVIQNQTMSGIASMGLRADSWEIELGS